MNGSVDRLRDLGRSAPHIYDFLAADFNVDWDLDHANAEALYVDVLDRLRPAERKAYVAEALMLKQALTDDDSVLSFLRWVGAGIDPAHDFGLTPVQWLAGLVERLEHPSR